MIEAEKVIFFLTIYLRIYVRKYKRPRLYTYKCSYKKLKNLYFILFLFFQLNLGNAKHHPGSGMLLRWRLQSLY